MTIKVLALVTVARGKEEDFVTAASSCVCSSRKEPGVLRYDLWREGEGDRRFVFDELYSNRAALEQHMVSDHFKAIGIAARNMTLAPPVIIVTQPVDVE